MVASNFAKTDKKARRTASKKKWSVKFTRVHHTEHLLDEFPYIIFSTAPVIRPILFVHERLGSNILVILLRIY